MRVRYTLQARSDLDAIYTYIDQRSLAGAQAVKELLERRIAGLGEFPFMAPETDEPGVYELSIVQYPYKVLFEVAGQEVWVLHIRHTSQRPWG
jgi:toxin ParE1/3/4